MVDLRKYPETVQDADHDRTNPFRQALTVGSLCQFHLFEAIMARPGRWGHAGVVQNWKNIEEFDERIINILICLNILLLEEIIIFNMS